MEETRSDHEPYLGGAEGRDIIYSRGALPPRAPDWGPDGGSESGASGWSAMGCAPASYRVCSSASLFSQSPRLRCHWKMTRATPTTVAMAMLDTCPSENEVPSTSLSPWT